MTRQAAVGRMTTDRALLTPGRDGSDARIAHNAAQNVTGNMTIITAVAQFGTGGSVFSKGFIGTYQAGTSVGVDNALVFTLSDNGTTYITQATSTAVAPYDVGEPFYYKVVYTANNGSGGNNVDFYTAPYSSTRPATDSSSWTKLGNTVTTAVIANPYVSNLDIDVGSALAGVFGLGKLRIFDILWLNSSGTPIIDVDFREQASGTTSFSEASANASTVTVRGSARIGFRNAVAGRTATVGRERIYNWHNVLEGIHSWDALDAVTYESEGDYSETGTRVDYVPDMGTVGGSPLTRDEGAWAAFWDVGYTPPGTVPGPLYYESMSRFNGRAGWDNDDLGYAWRGFWAGGRNAHGGLSTSPNLSSSTEYFNGGDGISQPYVVMGLGSLNETGHVTMTDSDAGGPTIGADDAATSYWGVTTEFGDLWPNTTHPIVQDQTVFFMARIDGASSWLEIVTRNASGTIVRDRQSITLDSQTPPDQQFRNLWEGMIHATSMSALKIVDGVPADSDLTRVVDWISPYISNAV